MNRLGFVCLLIVAAVAADSSAQKPAAERTTWRQFNQVFVKVIVPVTPRTPKQDGPVVEAWVAEKLKEMGETEYFAVTDWVPICDGLLEDDVVDNRVWDGVLKSKRSFFCPVGADIPQREMGRVLVHVGGFAPAAGYEVNINLRDEPGSRAVAPVQIFVGEDKKPLKPKEQYPYVAVMIAPPPLEGAPLKDDAK